MEVLFLFKIQGTFVIIPKNPRDNLLNGPIWTGGEEDRWRKTSVCFL